VKLSQEGKQRRKDRELSQRAIVPPEKGDGRGSLLEKELRKKKGKKKFERNRALDHP